MARGAVFCAIDGEELPCRVTKTLALKYGIQFHRID